MIQRAHSWGLLVRVAIEQHLELPYLFLLRFIRQGYLRFLHLYLLLLLIEFIYSRYETRLSEETRDLLFLQSRGLASVSTI
jgi:hypothetical protein